jgi:glycosyltransferase involved in cell wall biosynthesis
LSVHDANLPKISVVVPSYNQRPFLQQALESIFRQDYPRLEVIVMDGGSTDGSVSVIRSYEPRLKYWQSCKDGGQSAAINAGMRHCTGDLVAWLNSDDYYWRDALWVVAQAYASHPGYGLYIGNGFRHDQETSLLTPFCPRHIALNRRALVEGPDYVLQPATFFLRDAWQEADGLKQHLDFCMDWDLIIRIARTYPAVLINEFLAVSREYSTTKTSGGGMRRAEEICNVTRGHTGHEVTPGGLHYLLHTLAALVPEPRNAVLRSHLFRAIQSLAATELMRIGVRPDGFPEVGDPQDYAYVPSQPPAVPPRLMNAMEHSPKVSIVVPVQADAPDLSGCIDSIMGEAYPRLEIIVIDKRPARRFDDTLLKYGDRLCHVASRSARGLASTINSGLRQATGEIVTWLDPDDKLAPGAIWEAARLFATDPELDLVYGNCLYVDDKVRPVLIELGDHRTAFQYARAHIEAIEAGSWNHDHALPVPALFVRLGLLESHGFLDESCGSVYDIELILRVGHKAKTQKLERTQVYCRARRIPVAQRHKLAELFRLSQRLRPSRFSPRFRSVLRNYVTNYMSRRYGAVPHDVRFWVVACLVALLAATGIGNPELLPKLYGLGVVGKLAAMRSSLRRSLRLFLSRRRGSRASRLEPIEHTLAGDRERAA